MDYFQLFKNIGYIVVILTFIKAVYEYVMAMRWKKAEYLSKEVKDFFSDPNIKIVCTLLDYNIRKIEVDGNKITVTDELLKSALQTNDKKQSFTSEEARLRDMFDSFFDKLSNFNVLIRNGLVEKKQVRNYLSYYLGIISIPGRKPKDLVEIFHQYIDYYDFNDVKDLILMYKKSPIGTFETFRKLFLRIKNLGRI